MPCSMQLDKDPPRRRPSSTSTFSTSGSPRLTTQRLTVLQVWYGPCPYRARGAEAMLKISILDKPSHRRLVVEGKLTEAWVSELESAWSQARQERRNGRIVVDLSDMNYVDPKGEAALMAVTAEGAWLTAKGIYSQYVVKQLIKRAQKAQARRRRRNGVAQWDSISNHEPSRASQGSPRRETH